MSFEVQNQVNEIAFDRGDLRELDLLLTAVVGLSDCHKNNMVDRRALTALMTVVGDRARDYGIDLKCRFSRPTGGAL